MPASEHRLGLQRAPVRKAAEIGIIGCSALLKRHMHRDVEALLDMIQGPYLIIHSEAIIRNRQDHLPLAPEASQWCGSRHSSNNLHSRQEI